MAPPSGVDSGLQASLDDATLATGEEVAHEIAEGAEEDDILGALFPNLMGTPPLGPSGWPGTAPRLGSASGWHSGGRPR